MNSIKSLELLAHRNNQNHWVIRPTDLANWMREREKRRPKAPSENARGIPPVAPTPQHELDALKAQLELNFAMQRLEVSEQDNVKLKQEVADLKAELKESRDQLSQVWREVTDKLVSLARPHKRRGPFMLTEDMRVVEGRDNITNLFVD
jgi:small-conductance mechanosensitive channel